MLSVKFKLEIPPSSLKKVKLTPIKEEPGEAHERSLAQLQLPLTPAKKLLNLSGNMETSYIEPTVHDIFHNIDLLGKTLQELETQFNTMTKAVRKLKRDKIR